MRPIHRIVFEGKGSLRFFGRIEIPDATLDVVVLQSSFNSLPEEFMLDGPHDTEVFPLPVVLFPDLQAVADASADVAAAGDK